MFFIKGGEHVLRLHISVNDIATVGMLEGLRYHHQEINYVGRLDNRTPELTKVGTRDVVHVEPNGAFGISHYLDDVRVI